MKTAGSPDRENIAVLMDSTAQNTDKRESGLSPYGWNNASGRQTTGIGEREKEEDP